MSGAFTSRLREFMEDPTPVLGLLERLKNDPSLYVRRSVANNLNDVAKDHPERVVDTCTRWSKSPSPHRQWIIRHALRTCFKNDYEHLKKMALLRQELEITMHEVENGDVSDISILDLLKEVLDEHEKVA